MKLKKYQKIVLFSLLGGILGFSYYYFIGCNSGSCPIQSDPYISTAYGTVVGLVMSLGGNKKES